MRWSKVRKLVEESFATSVRGRVIVHGTNASQRGTPYRCDCGWGWLRVDGRTIARFDTHESYAMYRNPYHCVTRENGHPPITDDERTLGRTVEPGEFSRFDLHEACWLYLHSSLNASLAGDNPLVMSLAVLNAKVGKHRLRRIAAQQLHPLTRQLIEFRLRAEAEAARGAALAG